jgi:hypothetical protein
MTFPILQESCSDISDVNAEAVKNVRFHCSFSFSDVSDVVDAPITLSKRFYSRVMNTEKLIYLESIIMCK